MSRSLTHWSTTYKRAKKMSKKVWLVNDCLTTIPETKTFWHDLLDWIPGMLDKTGGYTPFDKLARRIEIIYFFSFKKPSLLVRNGSFFRKLNIKTKTIALLQDIYENDRFQKEVIESASCLVFNSHYTYSFYKDLVKGPYKIIPLGVDFHHFKPLSNKQELKHGLGIKDQTILYVGSSNTSVKGFNIIEDLIENTDYNFCLVMKDDYKTDNPRVKVFNKVNHDQLLLIYNACEVLVCTSYQETQHLSGIEAGACDLRIVANNIGIYYNRHNERFGEISDKQDYKSYALCIDKVLENYDWYKPRDTFLSYSLDKESCKKNWEDLITQTFTQ